MSKSLLIESTPHVQLSLLEGTGSKSIARGEFGRVGVPTQNGREYPKNLIEREIKRLSEDLKNRRVLGELDHPADGKTSLKRVSHVITKLWIEDDGRVMGEAEILNTDMGRQLKALIEAQVQVGVSSRGFGSTRTVQREGKAVEEVGDDYVLKTYDFVCDPAMKSAYPDVFTEDVDDEPGDPAKMFLEEFPEVAKQLQEDAQRATDDAKIQRAVDAAVERTRREMSEKFERNVADSLKGMRDEVAGSLREEFEADPEIGGARAVLSQIAEMVAVYHATPDEIAVRDALKAKDIELAQATESLEEALDAAKRATCMVHIEREISGHPMAVSIRKMLAGQVFESVEDADDRLKAVLEDIPEGLVAASSVDPEEVVSLREDAERSMERASRLEEKVVGLQKKLNEAKRLGEEIEDARQDAVARAEKAERDLSDLRSRLRDAESEAKAANEEIELVKYRYDKVAGLTNGRALLPLTERCKTRGEVDRLVEQRGSSAFQDEGLAQARLGAAGRGTRGSSSELSGDFPEGIQSGQGDPLWESLGMSMDHMAKLVGE